MAVNGGRRRGQPSPGFIIKLSEFDSTVILDIWSGYSIGLWPASIGPSKFEVIEIARISDEFDVFVTDRF